MEMESFQLQNVQAELDAVIAQNERLRKENASLREMQQHERSESSVIVDAKLKAFQFESERDRLLEQLEKTKRKYNQLHDAYLQKVKRCKALEDVFNRQKTLNGLVMKSSAEQRLKEQQIILEKKKSDVTEKANIESLEVHITKLQTQLDEAYDIIDELEFELESIDIVETENQRLQEQVKSLKEEKLKLKTIMNWRETHQDNTDAALRYNEIDEASRSNTDSLAESVIGDMDPEGMERAALTESLIEMAESESNCLRRELLRSRLRRTIRAARPTSSDA